MSLANKKKTTYKYHDGYQFKKIKIRQNIQADEKKNVVLRRL